MPPKVSPASGVGLGDIGNRKGGRMAALSSLVSAVPSVGPAGHRRCRLLCISRRRLLRCCCRSAAPPLLRCCYCTSSKILNIGRYIEITTTPTMQPTPIIIRGSMIEVSDFSIVATSSS